MKKIIILGASSGIGRELALNYAEAGNRIGIAGRRENLLEEVRFEYPERISIRRIDISKNDTLVSELYALVSEIGGLDMLVISSGTGDLNFELEFESEKRTIETNVSGFTAAIDWGYRFFESQGNGHLVAITSIAALLGGAEAPAYGASKAYQVNYLEALRIRAQKSGKKIFVTDIRPGFVDTDMAKGDGKFWVASVKKAAKQIENGIDKRRKIVYITKRWRIIGFVLRLLNLFK